MRKATQKHLICDARAASDGSFEVDDVPPGMFDPQGKIIAIYLPGEALRSTVATALAKK
jgi:hypothetical protein